MLRFQLEITLSIMSLPVPIDNRLEVLFGSYFICEIVGHLHLPDNGLFYGGKDW